jgi:hypothetical protein
LGKGNIAVFSRNCEILEVERSSPVGLDGCAGLKASRLDGYAWTDALTKEFPNEESKTPMITARLASNVSD